MKIRSGFVSNSSTSSFIIIGYSIKNDLENAGKIYKDFTGVDPEDDVNLYGLESKDFEIYFSEESENIIVGKATDHKYGGDPALEEDADEFSKYILKTSKEVQEKFKTVSEGKKPRIYFIVDDSH